MNGVACPGKNTSRGLMLVSWRAMVARVSAKKVPEVIEE